MKPNDKPSMAPRPARNEGISPLNKIAEKWRPGPKPKWRKDRFLGLTFQFVVLMLL